MEHYDKLDVEEVYLARGGTSVRLPMATASTTTSCVKSSSCGACAQAAPHPIRRGHLAGMPRIRKRCRARGSSGVESQTRGHVFNLCEDRTYSMRMWSRMILDAAARPPSSCVWLMMPAGGSQAHRHHEPAIVVSAQKARSRLAGHIRCEESLGTSVRGTCQSAAILISTSAPTTALLKALDSHQMTRRYVRSILSSGRTE